MKLFEILAQASTTQPGGAVTQPPWWTNQFIPILLIIVVFYLFLWRTKKNDERKRTDMLANLERGDRVQTIGGVLGTVVEVRDGEVLLKVDESSNAKMRFVRSAIHRVIEKEKGAGK